MNDTEFQTIRMSVYLIRLVNVGNACLASLHVIARCRKSAFMQCSPSLSPETIFT
jgi:hypothetical protein